MHWTDLNGPSVNVFWSELIFSSSLYQLLLGLSDKPCKRVAGFGWCYSLWCAKLDPTGVSTHALLGWPLPSQFDFDLARSALELRHAVERKSTHTVPRLLRVIRFHATHLETRTKESNMCASLRVIETSRHNKSKGCLQLKWDLVTRSV